MKKVIQTSKLLLFVFVTVFFVHCSFSKKIDKSKIDDFLQVLDSNSKFMGSVAIMQNGNIMYSKAVGYADIEKKLKSNENTKYRIGSVSKTFTASLILKAIEENKLKLSETLDKFFPSIKNSNKITIEMLLRHRSGIRDFTRNQDYLQWNTEPKSEQELLEIIIKGGSIFEPDSKSDYSNPNYILLSFILEKLYNKPYKTILDEKIIKTIGLTNTYYGGKTKSNQNECYSYKYFVQWNLEAETDMSIPMGAGALVSTPTDLCLFIDALMNQKIISASSLELMKKIKDEFGLGLIEFPLDNKKWIGHTGGIDGFASLMIYLPEQKLAIAMTVNGNNFDLMIVMNEIVKCYNGNPITIPDLNKFDLTAFYKIITEKGYDYVKQNIVEISKLAKKTNDEHFLNNFGYQFIYAKKVDVAINLFKINIELYPKSANLYDSLGEAYMINGNKELAIEFYEKALKIDPNLKTAIKALKKLKA